MSRRPRRDSGDSHKQRGNYRRHDGYYHQAKREGLVARSAYKLQEIQQRERLLRPGGRVLDLGCAPGAWLQLAAPAVGARGRVVGVDLSEVTIALPPWVAVLQGDVYEIKPSQLAEMLGGPCHVVLSDLAPHTTGVRGVDQARSAALVEQAWAIAQATLAPAGAFVAKVFDGPDVAALLATLRQAFDRVRVLRPQATRTHSKEIYLVAIGLRPVAVEAEES